MKQWSEEYNKINLAGEAMISWSVSCRDNPALKEMRFSNRWQKHSGAKGVCHGTCIAAVLRRGGKGFCHSAQCLSKTYNWFACGPVTIILQRFPK